jgi:ubiquinone/menaquinone biosynthesis C-methylase UbiE
VSLFWELHSGLPREGPGADGTTRKAAEKIPRLPDGSRVLDVGCGPGAQTLVLAREFPQAHITAVDRHAPFLNDLKRRARLSEVSSRIASLQGDMRALPFSGNRFDLIWSEGAIYVMGFEAGLRSWRPLLKENGCVAVTEISWLTGEPPDGPREVWSRTYPAMATIASNCSMAQAAGYEILDHFTIPERDWWTDYYEPLEMKMQALRAKYADKGDALAFLDEEHKEIDLLRQHSSCYGNVFYLLKKESQGQV